MLVHKFQSSSFLHSILGEKYWRLNELFNILDFHVDRNYPQNIASRWKGLPSSVDSALSWQDNKLFFFKGKGVV